MINEWGRIDLFTKRVNRVLKGNIKLLKLLCIIWKFQKIIIDRKNNVKINKVF